MLNPDAVRFAGNLHDAVIFDGEVDRPRREPGLGEQFDQPLADGRGVLGRLVDRGEIETAKNHAE